jgi:2-polyprenyl-3-methyl-5-hydroxy-6-metoxy-1,4-benzoquinol methylase
VFPPTATTRIDRFMARRPWSHNQHYHRWLLRQLPDSISRALDVECGTGELARLLARRAGHVDAIDTDSAMVDQARRTTRGETPVRFSLGSVLDLTAQGRYDAITAVAVLHHVDLAAALHQMRAALAPGGTLLVVGCYREATLSDRALSLAAVPANIAVGLMKRPTGTDTPPASMTAPTAAPSTTIADVRNIARGQLPGVRIHRALFWRYLLRYSAPAG